MQAHYMRSADPAKDKLLCALPGLSRLDMVP